MNTKTAFPTIYVLSADQNFPIWNTEYSPADDAYLNELLGTFIVELNVVWKNEIALQQKGKAIVADLFPLCAQATAYERENLQFLQFHISAIIMDNLISRKVFFYGFDWICNSLSDKLAEDQKCETDCGRIGGFARSKSIFISQNLEEALTLWISSLYYYARCTGGHNALANIFLEEFFGLVAFYATKTEHPRFVLAICQISGWCERHQIDQWIEKSSALMMGFYNKSVFEKKDKKLIAFQLSCLRKNYSGESRVYWLNKLESEYKDLLTPYERLQILFNRYQGDAQELLSHFAEIASRTKELKTYIQSMTNDPALIKYEVNRSFNLYLSALHVLIKNGKHKEVNQLIRIFTGTDEKEEFNNLLIVPNGEDGALYCGKDVVISSDTDPKEVFGIVQIGNEFLGTTHFIDNQLGFEVELPERYGLPDPAKANEYLAILRQHFKPEKILLIPHLAAYTSFYMTFGQLLPLQPILAAEQGITLAVDQSFTNPAKQRQIKEVLIWQGDAMTSEIECRALHEIFESKNLVVKILRDDEANKATFLEEYGKTDYDLVWFSGHGEFQHFEPHKSFVPLTKDLVLDLTDLDNLTLKIEGRRLLVMNVCNGANSALFNGPGSIGMSESLISASQSVISHLWPVDFIAGMIYGLILATFLADGLSYEDAYGSAVRLYKNGKDDILARLKKYIKSEDVFTMVINKDIDYQNFFYWGSLCYVV